MRSWSGTASGKKISLLIVPEQDAKPWAAAHDTAKRPTLMLFPVHIDRYIVLVPTADPGPNLCSDSIDVREAVLDAPIEGAAQIRSKSLLRAEVGTVKTNIFFYTPRFGGFCLHNTFPGTSVLQSTTLDVASGVTFHS